jgi:low temperature requirement protein LtrA
VATAPTPRRDDRRPDGQLPELFYDLVYVAVIGQAAYHQSGHVSVRGAAEFAVVIALVWIA